MLPRRTEVGKHSRITAVSLFKIVMIIIYDGEDDDENGEDEEEKNCFPVRFSPGVVETSLTNLTYLLLVGVLKITKGVNNVQKLSR